MPQHASSHTARRAMLRRVPLCATAGHRATMAVTKPCPPVSLTTANVAAGISPRPSSQPHPRRLPLFAPPKQPSCLARHVPPHSLRVAPLMSWRRRVRLDIGLLAAGPCHLHVAAPGQANPDAADDSI
ncbi:hypothetical protein E2562_013461 [Oryza meyeriana var. granulata]|uniref:Uncharacterized protein n=1 Tax=Oryza meyeriana var. granulata TaxID=110450 RepID=A0A6G1BUP1_9ORYZ|nr:hypothetical protein E2562_013461 [Oryza meyeriana var. granulata]